MTGSMDVAMNANAVVVEKKLSRAVMSSSHGFWSLGGFAGGGLGGIVIQNYGHLPHAVLVTVIALAAIAPRAASSGRRRPPGSRMSTRQIRAAAHARPSISSAWSRCSR